jgi:hypothetical protein
MLEQNGTERFCSKEEKKNTNPRKEKMTKWISIDTTLSASARKEP